MRKCAELRVFDDVASARARGRHERRLGIKLESNPFDSSTHPALFAAWAEGWIGDLRRAAAR